jgi:hypothetical protein
VKSLNLWVIKQLIFEGDNTLSKKICIFTANENIKLYLFTTFQIFSFQGFLSKFNLLLFNILPGIKAPFRLYTVGRRAIMKPIGTFPDYATVLTTQRLSPGLNL